MTLEECAEIFKNLQEEFYEEYKMYDLSALAMAIVFPLVCNIQELKNVQRVRFSSQYVHYSETLAMISCWHRLI